MMNTPTLFTSFFFLLFAFITINLPSSLSLSSSNNAELVQYKDGGNISPMDFVYILPAKIGPKGGGITLGNTKNSTCPAAVVLDNCAAMNGLVLGFTMQQDENLNVSTNSPVYIEFLDLPVDCTFDLRWVVVDDFPHPWIGIGSSDDDDDHPSKIIDGDFIIQRYQRGYKIVFCPKSNNNATAGACKSIGIHKDKHGLRNLILTDKDLFPFVFVNAH
ncbi:hypothetical protein PIB30_041368 [Stylosanthes scabra]|uniref:Uncharacterized protein n=1 Tax=Stylosanthes scabra TaxID=79078 RepID=A0ABU6ZDN3_9FABA|nr:hypothetical protein [Stylosanthes scabra]